MDLIAGYQNFLFDPAYRLQNLGIASAILSSMAFLPYIIDTIARRTQPVRSSWLVWSVLSVIAFWGQVYEGASASLWFSAIQFAGTVLVFLLSILIGAGRYMKTSDYFVLAAAAGGIGLWYMTDSAVYALAITIGISLLGGIPTVLGAYREPEKETMAMWFVSLFASVSAIFSVGKLDWVLLAYPLYLFTMYGAIVGAMMLGRVRTGAQAHAV